MRSSTFMVRPDTTLAALRQATAVDSTYDRVTFAAGDHLIAGTIIVSKPDLAITLNEGAVLSPATDVARLFDMRASGISLTGAGRFDGATQFDNPAFRQFIYVRDTADGFHVSGQTKPTRLDQSGALAFTKTRVAIEVDGADNVVVENIHMHNFRAGAYGLILRDVGTGDGKNAQGNKGNIIKDVFADVASGGGLPGENHVNGSWIRLDTSANGAPVLAPQLENVMITDNILLGGTAGYDAEGRTYYFVNIDSNIEAARDIRIAYNTLSDAVSYEIQIKNGYDSPIGISDVYVHDNMMDHAADDLLRRWPLKLQSNYDSPLEVTFQNNLAHLRPGLDADSLHLSVGFVDDIAFNGDFATDRFRTIWRENGDVDLVTSDEDDWIISSGVDRITSGTGADLIDFRKGNGTVIITDFKLGEDSLRLVDFGLQHVPQLLNTELAANGILRWGKDTLVIENDGQRVDLSALPFADLVFHDTFNTLFQGAGDVVIAGSPLNDRVVGSDFDDTMLGGDGADQIDGAVGSDWIYGENGNDRLSPGPGIDRLWGGSGSDTLVFGTNDGLNVVYDFEVGRDKIALRGLSFADLDISLYNGLDADIRTPTGDRLVLRNVSPDALDSFDFVLDAQDAQGVVVGGLGPDNYHGTNAADVFQMTPGTDRFYGYAGADLFVFSAGVGLNVVYDFEVGHDEIGLLGQDFDSLRIFMYNATDTEIRSSTGDRLVLRNVDNSELLPNMFQVYEI